MKTKPSLYVTNTMSSQKELFEPEIKDSVKMYVCGPTVYGLTHIGNARPPVFFNVVRHFLGHLGYQVTYVSNFTDVDDKIINKAKEEGTQAQEVAQKFTQAYLEDMEALGLPSPDRQPKVTEVMDDIVEFIKGLVQKGQAYVTGDGEVLFSVRKFKSYGKLSNRNLDDLLASSRVESHSQKQDPLDFTLWKPQKEASEPAWDSPWGKGRPGWHIECSVMALKSLGESFDIHGGGIDLIHPHHDNEIAQSEALHEKRYVKYWLHSNMLNVDSMKMSKSIGNIWVTREFIREHTAEVLKFILLSGHYRSPIDFSKQVIVAAQGALHRIYSSLLLAFKMKDLDVVSDKATSQEDKVVQWSEGFENGWTQAMLDDFNTPQVMAWVFDYVRAINAYLGRPHFQATSKTKSICEGFLAHMQKLSGILHLFDQDPSVFLGELRTRVLAQNGLSQDELHQLIEQRKQARLHKDYALGDQIRDTLLAKGVCLMDEGGETKWDVFFHDKKEG